MRGGGFTVKGVGDCVEGLALVVLGAFGEMVFGCTRSFKQRGVLCVVMVSGVSLNPKQ